MNEKLEEEFKRATEKFFSRTASRRGNQSNIWRTYTMALPQQPQGQSAIYAIYDELLEYDTRTYDEVRGDLPL